MVLDQPHGQNDVDIAHSADASDSQWMRCVRQVNRHHPSRTIDVDMRWPVLARGKQNTDLEPGAPQDRGHVLERLTYLLG
jgi:hypothetical protein